MITLKYVSSPQELGWVRTLFEEYAANLDFSLCFQGFAQEVASLPGPYARPHGRLLLGWVNELLAGCVALRPLPEGACEMKRLFVRPVFRGHGLGRRLVEELVLEAGLMGYRLMRLDTLERMQAARHLYQTLGFYPIEPYCDNPVEGAQCLELKLESVPSTARCS